MASKNRNDRLLLVAFLLSGFVALGYEMVWTRLLALVLGGEILGVLGVLAGFFLGMVIGAFTLSKHARRTPNPVRMFIILELIIAFYGLISPYLIYALSDAVPQWLGPVAGDNDSLIALSCSLLISSLVLLPATFGMGANFAYLVEAQRRILPDHSVDKSISRIYASNTLGATLGTFGAVYLVVPYFGFIWACGIFCLAGIVATLCAWYWAKANDIGDAKNPELDNSDQPVDANQNKYLSLLFVTGLLAIGLEIVVIHLLKQILANTIFTFANILGIYLVGTAIGAWLYQYAGIGKGTDWQRKLPAQLLMGLLLSTVICFGVLTNAPGILESWTPNNASYQQHLLAELWLAVLTFLLPTIFMGALFSFLVSRIPAENLGKAYAINTLGAACAPFLFGLILIPFIAPFHLLAIVWLCYWAVLGVGTYVLNWPREYFMIGGVPLLFLAIGFMSQPDLIRLPNGATELQRVEGLMGTVVVSERKNVPPGPLGLPHRILQVNNQFRMGGGAGFLERRIGNLPLLLSENDDSVLFLGIGSGTTIGVCQNYPAKTITAVEIVPQVQQVLHWFDEHSNQIFDHSGLSYHASDARRFVSAANEHYDVIVADLYHPARDGAGLLYTREHFEKLKKLLKDDGLFCQWLPAHQFDQKGLKTVLRTFNDVFTDSHVFLAGFNTDTVVVGLIGTKTKLTIDYEKLNRNIVSESNIQSVFENASDVFSTYLLNSQDVQALAGDGPLNSDLHPILLFEAPKSVYLTEQEKAHANLKWLLSHRKLWRDELVNPPISNQKKNAVQGMWKAAGLFLESKMFEQQGQQQKSWQKLVSAYRTQPDFSAARGRLLVTALQDERTRSQVMEVLNERDRNRLKRLLR